MPSGRAKATIERMATSGTPAATPQPSPEGAHEVVHWEYDASQEGQGFVAFAAVMIALAGVLNTLYGVAAIDEARFFVADANYVFGDLGTWGWFVVILGVVQLLAAAAIWRGAGWARWFGVLVVSCNAVLQCLWFPSRPILGMTILVLDLVALYGLLAHGGQRRAAREARGR
jgi:hypothetical protein